jgi:hypothetical protein
VDALTDTDAIRSTATSSPKWIVSGAARSENCSVNGSSRAILPTSRSRIATAPPIAPSTMPSMTNGQRMNQSVAPTSFITSTSRRRENSDSRIVLETRSTDATTSSTVNRPVVSFTTRVATRIFCVSSREFFTASIDGSIVVRPPPGAAGDSASRSASALSGLSGVTRNVSGRGFDPSRS